MHPLNSIYAGCERVNADVSIQGLQNIHDAGHQQVVPDFAKLALHLAPRGCATSYDAAKGAGSTAAPAAPNSWQEGRWRGPPVIRLMKKTYM